MTDYQKYINALRKCAKEHKNDKAFTGNIIVSDLCRDTADLLKQIEQAPKTDELVGNSEELKEPCEDCVSREAIDHLCFEFLRANSDDNIAFYEHFLDLPSVQPKTEWIPVSERLPNDREWYLGIFKESDTGWINPLPFICDYVGHETKATTKEFWILRGCTDRDERVDYYFNLECVAWMPLPKPYKESE